jgi:hypothetical protein
LGLTFILVNVLVRIIIAFADLLIVNWQYPAALGIILISHRIIYVFKHITLLVGYPNIVFKYERGKRVWYISNPLNLLRFTSYFIQLKLL